MRWQTQSADTYANCCPHTQGTPTPHARMRARCKKGGKGTGVTCYQRLHDVQIGAGVKRRSPINVLGVGVRPSHFNQNPHNLERVHRKVQRRLQEANGTRETKERNACLHFFKINTSGRSYRPTYPLPFFCCCRQTKCPSHNPPPHRRGQIDTLPSAAGQSIEKRSVPPNCSHMNRVASTWRVETALKGAMGGNG